jgi:DNA repair exonuclease SbcCD ATPase subunit
MFSFNKVSPTKGLQDILGQFTKTLTDLKEFVEQKEVENIQLTEEIQQRKAQLNENSKDMGTANKVITNITELIAK